MMDLFTDLKKSKVDSHTKICWNCRYLNKSDRSNCKKCNISLLSDVY